MTESQRLSDIFYTTAKLLYADQEKALELDSKVGSRGGEIDYSLLLRRSYGRARTGHYNRCCLPHISQQTTEVLLLPIHQVMKNIQEIWQSVRPLQTLAVILIDASQGVLVQTRRHARICKLMGIQILCLSL